MDKLNCIITDEKLLREKSKDVDLNDKDLKNDIKKLKDIANNSNIMALTAIQIGIPKKIIYIKNTKEEFLARIKNKKINVDEIRILINPIIVKQSGLAEYWESCASILEKIGKVTRPYKTEVEYIDINGSKRKTVFTGIDSTIFCHEYDHLDGILYIDKSNNILEMNFEKRKEFRKNHTYKIILK